MKDVAVCIISAITTALPDCRKAVAEQTGGPYPVYEVKNVFPMSAAFNAMILSSPARFVVQVDGDVVLKPWAVAELHRCILARPLYVCMVWGQLFEEGFGLGGSVRIWRRWPVQLFGFRDRRCVDRDLHMRVRRFGMCRYQAHGEESCFGTHYPRQSLFERFSKARGDTAKWRHLGRFDLIWDHVHKYPPGLSVEARGRLAGLQMPKSEVERSKNAREDWTVFWEDQMLAEMASGYGRDINA